MEEMALGQAGWQQSQRPGLCFWRPSPGTPMGGPLGPWAHQEASLIPAHPHGAARQGQPGQKAGRTVLARGHPPSLVTPSIPWGSLTHCCLPPHGKGDCTWAGRAAAALFIVLAWPPRGHRRSVGARRGRAGRVPVLPSPGPAALTLTAALVSVPTCGSRPPNDTVLRNGDPAGPRALTALLSPS